MALTFLNFIFLLRLWDTSVGWSSGKGVWQSGSTEYSREGVKAFLDCRTDSTGFWVVMITVADDYE